VDEDHLTTLVAVAEWELKTMPRGDPKYHSLHQSLIQAIHAVGVAVSTGGLTVAADPLYLSRRCPHCQGSLPGGLPNGSAVPHPSHPDLHSPG
jgi:hypothetical protein